MRFSLARDKPGRGLAGQVASGLLYGLYLGIAFSMCACSDAQTGPVVSRASIGVIYGPDDRRNYYAVEEGPARARARQSVAALVPNVYLEPGCGYETATTRAPCARARDAAPVKPARTRRSGQDVTANICRERLESGTLK